MYFDRQAVLAADQDSQQLGRWDIATGEGQLLFHVEYKQENALGPCHAFSQDGQLLATCSNRAGHRL